MKLKNRISAGLLVLIAALAPRVFAQQDQTGIQQDATKNVPINTRQGELNRLDTMPRVGIEAGNQNLNSNSVALRKPNKKELALVAPKPEDVAKYAAFLAREKTGIVRLIPDMGCDTNKNVIDVSSKCSTYTLPGSGASFSFRLGRYVGNYFSDLVLRDNALAASGNLNLGFFVMLGDIPLENVSAQTIGAAYLFDYAPPKDAAAVVKESEKFAKGAVDRDFTYRSAVAVAENTTYLFRSVAYRKEMAQPLVDNPDFNDIEVDKRKDVVVAFRVVRKDADGSATLLWQELARRDAPKLERPKKDDK
ncbi:MAG: hypothetical protein JSS81_13440 [Acidobacteria bacterium]|nr:hypothetical protein [Acidobacteriota bacterium]